VPEPVYAFFLTRHKERLALLRVHGDARFAGRVLRALLARVEGRGGGGAPLVP
jgi:hypothetical protein